MPASSGCRPCRLQKPWPTAHPCIYRRAVVAHGWFRRKGGAAADGGGPTAGGDGGLAEATAAGPGPDVQAGTDPIAGAVTIEVG